MTAPRIIRVEFEYGDIMGNLVMDQHVPKLIVCMPAIPESQIQASSFVMYGVSSLVAMRNALIEGFPLDKASGQNVSDAIELLKIQKDVLEGNEKINRAAGDAKSLAQADLQARQIEHIRTALELLEGAQ